VEHEAEVNLLVKPLIRTNRTLCGPIKNKFAPRVDADRPSNILGVAANTFRIEGTSSRLAVADASPRQSASRGSGRKVEPGAGRAVLNLDNPEVRIEGDFPREPLLRRAGLDVVAVMRAGEDPLDARLQVGGCGLRRGSV